MATAWNYSVQLRDTDAAGVLYFAHLLAICHGGYEAALREWGIDLRALVSSSEIAIPITATGAEYRRPIYCGDRLTITLSTQRLSASSFQIQYQVTNCRGQLMAQAHTDHVAINPTQRQRVDLPEAITNWVASLGAN